MARKTKSKGTPSLGTNQAWTPKTGAPYRKQIKGGVQLPEQRDVDADWETRFHDANKNAKAAQKRK